MKTKTTNSRSNAGLTKAVEHEPSDLELHALADESDEPVNDDEIAHMASAPLASSPVEFARFGLNEIAYVRRDVIDNMPVWAIHSAMGQRIGAAPTFEQAWGAILQNDLQPMLLN